MHVAVTIVRAEGLAKADFSFTGKGASDPFCEVHWKGEKVHKTKVVNNNLDPEWEETFAVGVGPGDTGDMVISVYDSDGPLTKGDFLGQVVVPAERLLKPTEGEESATTTHPLVPKDGLSQKALKLVQGQLTLKVVPTPPGVGMAALPPNAEEDAVVGSVDRAVEVRINEWFVVGLPLVPCCLWFLRHTRCYSCATLVLLLLHFPCCRFCL